MELWPACIDPDYVAGIRDFARREIIPHADDIDRRDVYPREILKAMAKAGYNAVTLPTEQGGAGLSHSHAAAVFEEVSYASGAVGISLITIFQAQTILKTFGNDTLKETYLPQFGKGLL